MIATIPTTDAFHPVEVSVWSDQPHLVELYVDSDTEEIRRNLTADQVDKLIEALNEARGRLRAPGREESTVLQTAYGTLRADGTRRRI